MPIVIVLVVHLVPFEPWESRSPRCNACVLVQTYIISITRPSKNSSLTQKRLFITLSVKVWVEEEWATKRALGSGGGEEMALNYVGQQLRPPGNLVHPYRCSFFSTGQSGRDLNHPITLSLFLPHGGGRMLTVVPSKRRIHMFRRTLCTRRMDHGPLSLA